MPTIRTPFTLELPEVGPHNSGFYWVAVQDSSAPGGYTNVLLWRMFTLDMLTKWHWYFEYRAALHKMQHPKRFVQVVTGWEHPDAIDPVTARKAELQRKITSCKGKVTEWTNKLEFAKEVYRTKMPMFPLESEPEYARAIEKLNAKKFELQSMQQEYAALLL